MSQIFRIAILLLGCLTLTTTGCDLGTYEGRVEQRANDLNYGELPENQVD